MNICWSRSSFYGNGSIQRLLKAQSRIKTPPWVWFSSFCYFTSSHDLVDIVSRVLHYVEELDLRSALKKISTNSSSFYHLISDNVGLGTFQSSYQGIIMLFSFIWLLSCMNFCSLNG
jgi:hypothetical protein